MMVAVKIKTPASPPSSRITSIGTKMTIVPSTNAIFTRSFSDRPACLTRYQAVSPVSGKNNASVTGRGRRLCVRPPIGVRPAEMMKNDTMKPSHKRKKSNSRRADDHDRLAVILHCNPCSTREFTMAGLEVHSWRARPFPTIGCTLLRMFELAISLRRTFLKRRLQAVLPDSPSVYLRGQVSALIYRGVFFLSAFSSLFGCPLPLVIKFLRLPLTYEPHAFEQASKHSTSGSKPW